MRVGKVGWWVGVDGCPSSTNAEGEIISHRR